MKRNILLLLLIFFLTIGSYSQSIYYEDDMKGYKSWIYEDNWKFNSGDLSFSWNPEIHDFDCSAYSQQIVLDDYADKLIINQYLQVFVPSVIDEMAEIYIIQDTDEYLVFEHNLMAGSWGDVFGKDTAIDISQFAGESIQLRFRTHGVTTFAWDFWKVFNVKTTASYENDLAITGFDGPNTLELNESGSFEINIKNNGIHDQSNFSVELYNFKTGDLLGDVQINETLIPGEENTYSIDWIANEIQNTALSASVISSDDDFTGNNIFKSHFLRIHDGSNFFVFIWDNDNNQQTLIDPEKGDFVQTDVGMKRAFDEAGIAYFIASDLPADLSAYDMIFVNMGLYCLT
ncbi:CARDB domain-containing protein [Bacteroidota bacterium]